VILRSEANLAASLAAGWDDAAKDAAASLFAALAAAGLPVAPDWRTRLPIR
jgi:hypothetical protein